MRIERSGSAQLGRNSEDAWPEARETNESAVFVVDRSARGVRISKSTVYASLHLFWKAARQAAFLAIRQ